jgi:hypothetical protein
MGLFRILQASLQNFSRCLSTIILSWQYLRDNLPLWVDAQIMMWSYTWFPMSYFSTWWRYRDIMDSCVACIQLLLMGDNVLLTVNTKFELRQTSLHSSLISRATVTAKEKACSKNHFLVDPPSIPYLYGFIFCTTGTHVRRPLQRTPPWQWFQTSEKSLHARIYAFANSVGITHPILATGLVGSHPSTINLHIQPDKCSVTQGVFPLTAFNLARRVWVVTWYKIAMPTVQHQSSRCGGTKRRYIRGPLSHDDNIKMEWLPRKQNIYGQC